MGTTEQRAKCWPFLHLLIIINTAGDVAENCTTEVEFGGVGAGENLTKIEENNYINLTVHVNDQNVFQIKISYQQNNLSLDLCKFIRNTTCEVSDSSNATSHCQCLSNHTVQFLKMARSSDSGLYTWTLRLCKTPEKRRDIFINIKKGNRSDDTASAATTATIVCVLLTVVVTATAGVVFWMRNKANRNIEVKDCGRCYPWRGSDHAADNQVNGLNNLNNADSADVIEPTANHSYDPNYAEVNDHYAIQHDDPNYSDIKEKDKSQPLESSYYEINMEKRSVDSPNAYVKRQGTSQSTDPTNPGVNSQAASQTLDHYYTDIKKPTFSDNYDPNHTNDKEHDESHNYDPNYADINEYEARQPPVPDYKQHSNHNYDLNCAEFKVEENSKPDDPNYAHVKKQMMRHPDISTDACVKAELKNHPDDLFYVDVKKQDTGLDVDTTYLHVKRQDTEQESVYSLKDKQKPAQPHNPTDVLGEEDTSERCGFVYNHLHDIRQHHDPNYAHIETNAIQLADLPFQQDKGHNVLNYPHVNKENTSQKDDLYYDHIKQQDTSQPAELSNVHVNKKDTIQSTDNYDHLINCSGVLVKVETVS